MLLRVVGGVEGALHEAPGVGVVSVSEEGPDVEGGGAGVAEVATSLPLPLLMH